VFELFLGEGHTHVHVVTDKYIHK